MYSISLLQAAKSRLCQLNGLFACSPRGQLDFASSSRAAEDRTRWKEIVIKSSVVPQRPPKVMGYTKLD